MNIETYTVTFNRDEMFDLAYGLESYLGSSLTFTDNKEQDKMLNEQDDVVGLLQTFVSSAGYRLSISKKSKEGYSIFDSNEKEYRDAHEWYADLLKQRRKEYDKS